MNGLFAQPDLRSSVCDFPDECLDKFRAETFGLAERLWWGGVAVASIAGAALLATAAGYQRLLRFGVVAALYVSAGLLSPVLRGPGSIPYDDYNVVTVITPQYLLAIGALQLASLILVWDLVSHLRASKRAATSPEQTPLR
ncbi:MAG: hypothetical protein U0R78_15785 [Nocardioidaceae bacterium]